MLIKRFSLLVLFVSIGIATSAQTADDFCQWILSANQITAAPGGIVILDVTLVVKDKYIVYQDMTSFAIEEADGIMMGEPVLPPAKEKLDSTDGETKKVYAGTELFKIPFSIASTVPSGTKEIQLIIKYQGCSERLCYFPQTLKMPVQFRIGGAAANLTSTAATVPQNSIFNPIKNLNFQDQISKGGLLTFLFIFVMGFLTSLTPCVYPLIPITVSIFGAKETKSKLQAFSLASVYVLGIAVMYSSLGFFAAKTGAIFGQFMSNPVIVSIIAIFFVAMGVSMLGVYELRLPGGWQNRLAIAGGKGYFSAFLMGLVAGVVAAPCTGPVLAAILAHVTYQGNVFYGVSLLFVYSLGLGFLFLLIGTYSGLISKLPKSGQWMESVKSVFAIILFVSALYFLGNAFRLLKMIVVIQPSYYAVLLILLWIGIFKLGAVHYSFHGSQTIKNKKILGIIICTLSLYGITNSFLVTKDSAVKWNFDIGQGLSLAKSQSKPVMIDFYADWCTVCKELDAYTYSDAALGKALERFVCIKVDIESKRVNKEKIKKEYNITGLPLIVFIDSNGKQLDQKRINGSITAEEFIKHIEDIR